MSMTDAQTAAFQNPVGVAQVPSANKTPPLDWIPADRSPATSQAVKALKTAVRQWRIGGVKPSSFSHPKGRPPLRWGVPLLQGDLHTIILQRQRSKAGAGRGQGVYWHAERGERQADGRQKVIAYAVGCNPDIDAFDDWWALARNELGGDDFGEYFDPQWGAFTHILNGEDDLELTATATRLMLWSVTS